MGKIFILLFFLYRGFVFLWFGNQVFKVGGFLGYFLWLFLVRWWENVVDCLEVVVFWGVMGCYVVLGYQFFFQIQRRDMIIGLEGGGVFMFIVVCRRYYFIYFNLGDKLRRVLFGKNGFFVIVQNKKLFYRWIVG